MKNAEFADGEVNKTAFVIISSLHVSMLVDLKNRITQASTYRFITYTLLKTSTESIGLLPSFRLVPSRFFTYLVTSPG